MIENLTLTAHEYWNFYCRYVTNEWRHMTPMKYGIILAGICLCGWLCMKNGPKSL